MCNATALCKCDVTKRDAVMPARRILPAGTQAGLKCIHAYPRLERARRAQRHYHLACVSRNCLLTRENNFCCAVSEKLLHQTETGNSIFDDGTIGRAPESFGALFVPLIAVDRRQVCILFGIRRTPSASVCKFYSSSRVAQKSTVNETPTDRRRKIYLSHHLREFPF